MEEIAHFMEKYLSNNDPNYTRNLNIEKCIHFNKKRSVLRFKLQEDNF